MDYLFVKWVHILSSTILFGTGIGSAFYLFMAHKSKDTASIAFATRHVVIADFLFTTPRSHCPVFDRLLVAAHNRLLFC